MKKLICIAAIALPLCANAAYVTPTAYKDHSCEELKEDYKGFSDEYLKLLTSDENKIYAENFYDKLRASELRDQQDKADAHVKAITRAAAKVNCALPVKAKK